MYVVLIHNEGYFLILKSICVTISTRSTCSSLRGARRLRSHLRRRGAGWDPISGEEGWDLISDGDSEVGIWVLSLRLSLKMVGQRRILVLSFVLLEIVVALHTPRELLICIMPFFKTQLFSLCEYKHNTTFYYREKRDIWNNSLYISLLYLYAQKKIQCYNFSTEHSIRKRWRKR